MNKNIMILLFIIVLSLNCQSTQKNTTAVNPKISHAESLEYKELDYDQIVDILKNNPDEIVQNKYRAEYYPVRIFYKIPYRIRKKVKEDEKIVMLTPKGGKYRLFMLFPDSMLKDFQFYARKHKKIKFICQPLQLFNRRSPLIRLNSIVSVD